MKDDLGNRMKMYESVTNTTLIRKIPVVARIDGKAFHTLTKGMNRPWDNNFIECMKAAARAVASEAQGCKIAYVQSDEISILLTDNNSLNTQPWFGYETRKLCSIAAATATAAFCVEYSKRFPERWNELINSNGYGKLPRFDARFWNIPEQEVPNYFIWRQQDAVRNSKQMLGRAYFSHKELEGKSSDEICRMVYEKYDVNWFELPHDHTIGTSFIKEPIKETVSWTDKNTGSVLSKEVERNKWVEKNQFFLYKIEDYLTGRFINDY